MKLPSCGIYRTRAAIENVPAQRLVYFHNHGDPGPGLYLPEAWSQNEAIFRAQGTPLREPSQAADLTPLPAEGFYVAERSFVCCAQECTRFEKDALVQLGYNREGAAILFVPTWGASGLQVPERGTKIDEDRLSGLRPLRVRKSTPLPSGTVH